MKLHELINFRNSLQTAIDLESMAYVIEKNKQNLKTVSYGVNEEYQKSIDNIISKYDQIQKDLSTPLIDAKILLDEIQKKITELSSKFFEKNYDLEMSFPDNDMLPQNIRNYRHWRRIRMDIDDSPDKHLLSRIYLHSNFKYPALEIGCRDGEYTQYLIASDPLYIADVHQEFLASAVEHYHDQYKSRVRKYLIKDNKIDNLPFNQFNFIFSYNFFNYLSFDSIKQWMLSAYQWLRPGGVILFTYNNSDIGVGAAYAESCFMSYVPRSMLVPMCESIGFELIDHRDYDPNISWVEFRKPGELKTIKASQALGEIKNINH
jgi:SAM-dependent methyltransferase